tara:strand:- start:9604 stop:13011 length:3408 start_codon:yes stop_codon:yes gene_type:complete
MALTKLQFQPGINTDITSYSNEGGWRDCDKIRFRFGYPEKMGGWSKYSDSTYLGTVRGLHNWIALDGSDFLGLGSHIKYYIEEGQIFNDITPVRTTTSAGQVTFTATDDSNIIKVTNAGHGAAQNDFVTFSGAESLGPNITAALLNTEHQITAVLDADNYQITLTATANTTGVRQTTLAGTSAGAATHTGKTQSATSGSGTGAEFTVVAGSSSYTSVTVTNIGTGYAVNDTITIPGASLGGSTPANNLTITVTSLDGDILDGATSGVKTLTITSQAQAASNGIGPQTTTPVNDGMNPSLNDNPIKTVSVASGTSTGSATFTNVTGTVSSGNGSGAKFTITTDGSGGYAVDAVTDGGTRYSTVTGNGAQITITIPGTSLGGATTANDLVLNITSVEPHTFDVAIDPNDSSSVITSFPAGTTSFVANFTENTVGVNTTIVSIGGVQNFTYSFLYEYVFNSVTSGGSGYRVGDQIVYSVFANFGHGVPGSAKTFTVDSLINNTVAEYQINVGLNTTVGGTGWGAGQYYGVTSAALQTTLNEGGTLSSSDTTLTLTDTTGIVAGDVVLIDNELILVGGVSSTGVQTVGNIVTSGGSAGTAATYTGKSQASTSGSGTGAEFTVVATTTTYTSVTATTAGSGYAVGDTITIAGNTLGGATPLNDVTFTVTAITNDLTGCTRGYAGTLTSSNVNTFGPTVAATHADGSVVRLAKGNADPINDFAGWGDAASGGVTTRNQIRLWSHDNFVEDLILNPRDDQIYYWDRTNNLNTRAIPLNTRPGTRTSIPTKCKQVLVSDTQRHVIAFGADDIGSSASDINGNGIQDPLLIRFSSRELPTDFFPTVNNTAGTLPLGAGSTFMQAIETKREILVWTDTALTSMRFVGEPNVFGLQQISSNITIMSPNAAAATEDFVFWMGIDTFYVYDGRTQTLPCTVRDKVFLNFNLEERSKVMAGVNTEFSEVIWFYPSANATENDKYVTFNYSEKVWYFGTLSRTAWLDRGTRTFPLATANGYLYNHELGYDDDGIAMNSFIESAGIDIADGERFSFVNRVIPDLTFEGSVSASSPQATFTIKGRNYPGADFEQSSAGTAIRTASVPVETFTNQLDVRVRGRSFALRVESDALGSKWKLGSPRVDVKQDGRR